MPPATDGQWYMSVVCEHCNHRILLYRDLSEGKSKLRQTRLYVICSNCGKEGAYQAEHYFQPQEGGNNNALLNDKG